MSVTNFQTRLKRNCGYNQYTVVQNKPSYNKGLKKALRNYIFLLLLLFTPDARTIYTRAHMRACTYNIYCYMNSTSSTVKYKGAYIRVGKMLFCTGHLITMKKKSALVCKCVFDVSECVTIRNNNYVPYFTNIRVLRINRHWFGTNGYDIITQYPHTVMSYGITISYPSVTRLLILILCWWQVNEILRKTTTEVASNFILYKRT